MVDAEGRMVGVVSTDTARQMARDAGLDLVEVAPDLNPPVCKILDFGKLKYEEKKKAAKARKASHQVRIKEVRFRPRTDQHDIEIKVNNARRFLEEGDKVLLQVQFRGREMAHTELGTETLNKVAEMLADISTVEQAPRREGRRINMIIAPGVKKKKHTPAPPKPKTEPPAAAAPAAQADANGAS